LVQRTEVVRAAEARAQQVIDAADAESRRQRNETEDFLDQRLGSFEILLDRLTKTVANGRQRLTIGIQNTPEQADPAPGVEDAGVTGFFDQDRS
jgi:signal transduction histidine kinase